MGIAQLLDCQINFTDTECAALVSWSSGYIIENSNERIIIPNKAFQILNKPLEWAKMKCKKMPSRSVILKK